MSWEKVLKQQDLFEVAQHWIKRKFIGDSSDRDGHFSIMMVIEEYMEEEPAHFKQLLDEAMKYVIDNNTREEIIDWYIEEEEPTPDDFYYEEDDGFEASMAELFGGTSKRRNKVLKRIENHKKVAKSMRVIANKLRNEHFSTHDGLHQYENR